MLRRIVFIFALLTALGSFAQSTSELRTNSAEVIDHRSILSGLSIFMAGYPSDDQNVGTGFGLEYQFNPYIAVFGSVSHMSMSSIESPFNEISGGTTSTNSYQELGVKYFPYHWWIGAPFISVGYQRGVTNAGITPGVFNGPDESVDLSYEGAFLGTGFRFYSIKNRFFTLLLEAEIKYAPGAVQSSNYVVDSTNAIGLVQSGHVEASLGYGFVPSAQVGIQF